ncbi:MAG: CotH kinase family protein [Candidatus Cryptobacteroides sp.]
MKHFYKTLLLLAVLLAGCNRLDPSDDNNQPAQPEGYAFFQTAYAAGYKYSELNRTSDSITVTFVGDNIKPYEVVMSLENVVIDDCTVSEPRICAVDSKGYWMIGGVPTKIRKVSSLDYQAIPFYLTYADQGQMRLYVSNGNVFVYEYYENRFGGDIPKIYLTTDDRQDVYSKEEYQTGKIEIKNPDRKFWKTEEFSATMRIRGRGNSTWGMPKKPYKIKLDSKACLFDMSTDKEWCLLANYCDKSLVRNLTAMEISRRLGFSWTPKMVPVEVYLNGRYDGVYNFCEHKKVSSERVDINVDAGDILFEIEQQQDEIVCWWTDHGCPMMFSDPEEPSQEQIDFAKQFFRDFETALWNKEFEKVYSQYIDKDSFIDYFIIQELTKNVDGNLRKSSYLTLPKDGKLEMYFVWDFDISMGNCDYYYDGLQPWEGWWIKDQGCSGRYHGWYYRLFMDPNFVSDVKARWKEVYPQLQTIPEWIQDEVKIMGDAPARNFKRWDILNTYVWPNYKVTGSYKGEVDWLLENYTRRLAWMNNHILAL